MTTAAKRGLVSLLLVLMVGAALLPSIARPQTAEAAANRADLFVSSVVIRTDPMSGFRFADITIKNQASSLSWWHDLGGAPTASAGAFYVDIRAGDTLLRRIHIDSGLAGGETYVIRSSCVTATVVVDSTNAVREGSEANNTATYMC